MTAEDLEKIYSNDYADFIISYGGNPAILEKYKDSGINIINFYLAVVHLPASVMTEDVISRMSYANLPSLFGLTSQQSLESSGIIQVRNIPALNLKGNGVLIGIADTGIDYTNPVFQYADNTTRIASIWDQTIKSDQAPAGMDYGTEFTREEINEALKSEDPFSIVPSRDEIGHGTMVAGIAAGNEVPESNFSGVAPGSELVIVKMKPAKPILKQFFRFPEDQICYQENDLIFGIQYLFNYAARVNKPIVVCIAVDTAQYAHDGRGTTSSWLSIMAVMPGIGIIIPVGNEGNAKGHYQGIIEEETRFDTVELNVGVNENGFSMEIWGNTPNLFSVDITAPSGEYVPRFALRLDTTKKISFVFEQTIIYVDYSLIESQSGEQLILLRFTKPSQGIWVFRVYSKGVFPISFNIWLPMSNFIEKDTFFIRSDPYITLLSLACARNPITVTAYDTANESMYLNAGRGYTRIDLIKPDVAAPGVNIVSPTLDQGFTEVTGTSAAAAHTAGVAAMLFEWGIVQGNYPNMTSQDMKIFMIRGARRKADLKYPNREWGYGILDIYNIFRSIRGEE
jgi:subtilisin family serine protease